MWQLASLFRLPSSSPPSPFHGAGFGSCFPKASFLASSFSAQLLEKPADWAPRVGSRGDSQPQQENGLRFPPEGLTQHLSPAPCRKGCCPAAQISTPGRQASPWASRLACEAAALAAAAPAGLGVEADGLPRLPRRAANRESIVCPSSLFAATSRTPDPSDAPSPGFADSHVVPSQLRTEVHVGDYSVLDTGL